MRDRPVFSLDTSALVKRYLPEPGTPWVRRIVETSRVAIAEFGLVEFASALARRTRMGEIAHSLAEDLLEAFLQDVEEYWVARATRSTVLLAIDLVRSHSLRAYDALQLATALELAGALEAEGFSLTFVSADDRLCAAAEQEGLTA
ncbi:MAG: type II toxin-antitoxin system VapC family toxin, partial [Anaerolineae bacterium]